jgi:hypothetical protein
MAAQATATAGKEHWGGLLFGGIFAAIGIGFLILSVLPTLHEGWRMQGWQPVSAQLLDTELRRQRSDGSTTYRVTASYRYQWQGRRYSGSRVGIAGGADNVGDWQQQHYRRLKRARDNGGTITVWLDPKAPGNAVIDRDIRWGLLAFELTFVIAFGGAGVAIILFTLRGARRGSGSASPWLDNPAWRDNRIRAGGRAALWLLWLFAILWSLFMIPLWLNADELRSEGMPLSLLPYLLPLVGLALLAAALAKSLQWRRFGRATLSLEPFPGQTGGRVAGHIDLPLAPGTAAEVTVRLSCIHVYWRRSGNKRERREEVVWQDRRQGRLLPGPQGGRIAFDFHPEAGLPPSSEGSDRHKWVLAVQADLPGPDLAQRFTIPVFAVPGEAAVEQAQPAAVPSAAVAEPSAASLPEWLQLGYRAGGLALTLPMFRNLKVALPISLFGAVFGAIGLFLLQREDAPLLIGMVFTLFGALALLGGLYALGNSLEVVVTARGVRLTRRLFGLARQQELAVSAILGLEKRIGAQAGGSAYYRVYATGQNGRRTLLADSLPSASAADYLIEQFRRQLRLKEA